MGLLRSIEILLESKFGINGIKVFDKVKIIKDPDRLETVIEVIRLAESPEEIIRFMEENRD
jgi:hypothetical protein